MYNLLETNLKALYAARNRVLDVEERWLYRGSWLLLYIAIQACSSNDSYDILRDEKVAPSESELLLEILQLNASSTATIPTTKVSRMPQMPYSKRISDHLRYDSAFSTVSSVPAAYDAVSATKVQVIVPTPAQIWRAILEASTDQSKTTPVAEAILGYVWPEKDATIFLYEIGHPQKRLGDGETDQLHTRFQELLFPEYEELVQRHYR